MPTTLAIKSFSKNNIRETTVLTADAAAGDILLTVDSTQGYDDDIIYVGWLSIEGCEKAVIASVSSATRLTLTTALALPHSRFEAVSSVVGDKIHIHRALNVDGTVPADAAFSVLVTRTIDPDQMSTYYTDSSGSSDYWYRSTYYNETSLDETDLTDSEPRRGGDFGHYASLSEIRTEAGFDNATNLSDTVIDQQRRIAEAEINAALGDKYTVPFNAVPERIHTLTIQLAAALLVANAYQGTTRGQAELKAARDLIKAYQSGDQTITDENGTAITSGEGISSWPDDSAPRAFVMGERWYSADSLELEMAVKNAEQVKQMLTNLGLDLHDLKGAMTDVGDHAKKYFGGQVFDSRGGVLGQPWPRLSDAYAAQKAKRYPGRPPWVRTGVMQRSFTSSPSSMSVTISNDAPWFKYHLSSAARTRIPRRVMIGICSGI